MTDVRQAEVLTDPVRFEFFKRFRARSGIVGRAATEVGCLADAMLDRVRKLVSRGLLRVDHEELSSGRAVEHDRSTADGYFVPFHATSFAELEEILTTSYRASLALVVANAAPVLRSAGIEGRRIFRTGDSVHVGAAPAIGHTHDLSHPELRSPTLQMREPRLTREEAKALHSALGELVDRAAVTPARIAPRRCSRPSSGRHSGRCTSRSARPTPSARAAS